MSKSKKEELLNLVNKYPNDAHLGEALRLFVLSKNGMINHEWTESKVDSDFEILVKPTQIKG